MPEWVWLVALLIGYEVNRGTHSEKSRMLRSPFPNSRKPRGR